MDLFKLFGFRFQREDPKDNTKTPALVPPTSQDGALEFDVGPASTYSVVYDIEGTISNETDLVNKYRDMSLYPEVEMAVNEVVNDLIIVEDNSPPVKIQFGNEFKFSDSLKEKIEKEYKNVLRLLSFNSNCYEIVKRWYVDGKLYYQVIIDKADPSKGIAELRYIDPRYIKKIRELIKEQTKDGAWEVKGYRDYFLYTRNLFNNPTVNNAGSATTTGIKIHEDDIVFCHSGLLNNTNTMVLSYLHKAIRPYNQLKTMEDALVIYRITRAPERRIFNVDVEGIPPNKAKQYLQDIMTNYKNKLVYNPDTGEIRDDRRFSTMMEDFWFPRRGDKTSEVTTLPGGQNLSEIADIEYFQKKLYKSLGIPVSRLESDNGFNMGRASEITREELKFSKHIIRLRKRFSLLFEEILKRQLILKKITTEEDWEYIKENIYFDFKSDSYFSELCFAELMKERLDVLDSISNYTDEDQKYFSKEYVQKKILHLTDDDVIEIEAQRKGLDTEFKTPQELKKELSAPKEETPEEPGDLNLPSEENPEETPSETPSKEEAPTEEETMMGYGTFSNMHEIIPEDLDYYEGLILEDGEAGEAGDGVDSVGADYFDSLRGNPDFDPSGKDESNEPSNSRYKVTQNKKSRRNKVSSNHSNHRGIALMFHNLGDTKTSKVSKPKTVKKSPDGKKKNKLT